MKVREHTMDSIHVEPFGSKQVELRIGESKRGKTRFALLTKKEARIVGYALLTAAEQGEER